MWFITSLDCVKYIVITLPQGPALNVLPSVNNDYSTWHELQRRTAEIEPVHSREWPGLVAKANIAKWSLS
jgi:hypothetical protein